MRTQYRDDVSELGGTIRMLAKSRSDHIREYLKPDPRGYYIIPLDREALSRIPEPLRNTIEIEEISGNEIIIKTKSRAIAKRILKILNL